MSKVTVQVMLDPTVVEKLDQAKGDSSRSAFLRDLVVSELNGGAHDNTPSDVAHGFDAQLDELLRADSKGFVERIVTRIGELTRTPPDETLVPRPQLPPSPLANGTFRIERSTT